MAQRVAIIQQIDSVMAVVDFYMSADPALFRKQIFPAEILPAGLVFNATQMAQYVQIGLADGAAAAAATSVADLKEGELPAACTYNTTKVACGSDKDCFNWGVEKCASRLAVTQCDHASRTCAFSVAR